MAVPVVAARAAIGLLVDDLEAWVVRFVLLVLLVVALPISAAAVGFGGLLAIFGNVAPHVAAPTPPGQTAEGLAAVTPDVVRIGASGGRLFDGWTNRAALNQYDQRNYRSASTWLTWRNADCSAAALDWLLGAYGQPAGAIDDVIALMVRIPGSPQPSACSMLVVLVWLLPLHAAVCNPANHATRPARCDR